MRIFMKCLVLALCVVALAACGSGTENDPTGRTWQLTDLEGAPLVDGTTIDLTITTEGDDGVNGSAGCNSYNGPATVNTDDNSMTIGPDLISTMMACEESIMDQELKYLDALVQVSSYQMASDELILEDAQGIAIATFR